MGSPVAHVMGAVGAYLGATSTNSSTPIRGYGTAAACCVLAAAPDLPALFLRGAGMFGETNDARVVAILHGFTFGLIASAALAGAIPALREKFWAAVTVLFAAHASQALVDAMSLTGAAWFAPFDWKPRGFGLALLPTADARIVSLPFVSALKIMLVEAGVLLPMVWTGYILGRETDGPRSRAAMVAYALSWPAAFALAFWCVQRKGSF
jgi:hypothetical protein